MPTSKLSVAALLVALAFPAIASAQQTGVIDRVEAYQSQRSGDLFLRVAAHGQGPLDLYALPASEPCTTVAAWTGPDSGERKFDWLVGEAGQAPLTIEHDRALIERGDGPQRRICLLGDDERVVAERLIDLSPFERVSKREAVRWTRNLIACDADECRDVRSLFIRCKRRSSTEVRCFARWRQRNSLTGTEKVTWLHEHFRVSGKLDSDGVVRADGRKFDVGRGDGRP
jgi:hypothetical protein